MAGGFWKRTKTGATALAAVSVCALVAACGHDDRRHMHTGSLKDGPVEPERTGRSEGKRTAEPRRVERAARVSAPAERADMAPAKATPRVTDVPVAPRASQEPAAATAQPVPGAAERQEAKPATVPQAAPVAPKPVEQRLALPAPAKPAPATPEPVKPKPAAPQALPVPPARPVQPLAPPPAQQRSEPAPSITVPPPSTRLPDGPPTIDVPKAPEPKVEPKAEAVPAKPPAPQVAKPEPVKPAEPPKAEVPTAEPPKVEAPKVEQPKAEQQKTEPAKAEASKPDEPKAEVAAAGSSTVFALVEKARRLFIIGNVSQARAILLEQVDRPSADLHMAIGRTYDPNYLARLSSPDASPDAKAAARYYKRAIELGSVSASRDLDDLKKTNPEVGN